MSCAISIESCVVCDCEVGSSHPLIYENCMLNWKNSPNYLLSMICVNNWILLTILIIVVVNYLVGIAVCIYYVLIVEKIDACLMCMI